MAQDDVGHRHDIAHQEVALAHALYQRGLAALELPVQRGLDPRHPQRLGQNEAVPRRQPERRVEFVQQELGQTVLPRAVKASGRVGKRSVPVGQKGQDRRRIGDRHMIGNQHRHLARRVEGRDPV